MQRIAAMPKLPLPFTSMLENSRTIFIPLTANRHLRDVLIAKGYVLKYQGFAGHHSPVNLRGTFSDSLMFLLSDQSRSFGVRVLRFVFLFAGGTIPAAFKVTESVVGSTGVILANYERGGAVQTGSLLISGLFSPCRFSLCATTLEFEIPNHIS